MNDNSMNVGRYVTYGDKIKDKLRGKRTIFEKGQDISNEIVRDEEGRQRFHGAFTGGFSSGYYNTVGSVKGFEPKQFESKRNKRSNDDGNDVPEDFMDKEDFEDYGIAPKHLSIRREFLNTFDEGKSLDFYENSSIGVKILRSLGIRRSIHQSTNVTNDGIIIRSDDLTIDEKIEHLNFRRNERNLKKKLIKKKLDRKKKKIESNRKLISLFDDDEDDNNNDNNDNEKELLDILKLIEEEEKKDELIEKNLIKYSKVQTNSNSQINIDDIVDKSFELLLNENGEMMKNQKYLKDYENYMKELNEVECMNKSRGLDYQTLNDQLKNEKIVKMNISSAKSFSEDFLRSKQNKKNKSMNGISLNSFDRFNRMCSKHSDVSSQKIPRQGISGEAFGIGAFETDDMDVYDHEINISDDYDIDLTVEDSLEKKKSFETEKDERNSIVYDDNNRRQLLDRLFNEGFTSNHSIFIVEKLMKNIRLKNNFVSTTDDCLDGFRSAKQIPSNKGENILNRNVIPLNWHMKGIGAIRQLYENESMSIISTMKEKEIERVKEMSEKRNEMMRNVDERIRIKNEENEEIIEKKKRMMKNEIKEEKIERKQMDTYLNKHFVREGIVTKKDDDDEKELEELQNMMRAAKLGNYGKETRKIIEWQPIELICRRCNIQFRSIIKSENGIIQTQEQSLKKSENEKQIKLSNIGKRSGQHSKNPFAFLNDTNGDLETNPLSNRKPKAAMIIDQIDNFDEMIMEEEMEESMANQTQLEEVFSSTIDEEDEGKQFGYSKETIDYLYDICRRDDDDDTQSDDLTKMPNSLKMFNESSNSSIQFRTAKQRQYSND